VLQVWRVIDAGYCTLLEAQTVYSISDIIEMTVFLEFKEAKQREAEAKDKG